MSPLPFSLLLLLTLFHPTLSTASPKPALVPDGLAHLMPLHTLFYRQLADLQSFTDALGGFRAPPITNSGDAKKPFQVNGESLSDFKTAGGKSCDIQFNDCQRAANQDKQFSVGECDDQKKQCNGAQDSASVKDFATGVESTFLGPDPDFPDFDLFCDA
ncbi:hypothetical protein P154DRAFT_425336 [Amniculicola lignicola CBS 123094]|uniref:Uncharacterized protein n=1 Tax=Amniculicola lignicola CBS 123094 TaxID=1392246 RepID=A0A6A5WVI2_9PLEO|nr:hypothetical protein P154DRAFT_425336 [Amniculicola lignicola CBS 123094]